MTGNPPSIPADPRRPWLYRTEAVDDPLDEYALNALGGRGWRLCNVLKFGGRLIYTFLRPGGSDHDER
jgi:hypothetical protein